MVKETTVTGLTVEEAIKKGAAELGMSVDKIQSEVITEPKKGFLGFGSSEAKVRVFYEVTPAILALEFLKKLFENMKINADIKVEYEDGECANFVITGSSDELGLMIGHHGDVLESVQYLTMLAANKNTETYYRITVDINEYRKKREETLRVLAQKIAERVLKYRKSYAFEPMTSNERRIIHSELQNKAGITTYSVGIESERKVIVALENSKAKADAAKNKQ